MGISRSFQELALKLHGPVRRQVAAEVARVARETGDAVLTTIVPITPVDTGRARSNYEITFGPVSFHEPRLIGPFDRSGVTAVTLGRQQLKGYRLSAGTINVVNFVPYIHELHLGSSAQAEAYYMVDTALAAGTAKVRSQRIRIRI